MRDQTLLLVMLSVAGAAAGSAACSQLGCDASRSGSTPMQSITSPTLLWKSQPYSYRSVQQLYQPGVATNGILYTASFNGLLFALNASTGMQQWVQQFAYQSDVPATATADGSSVAVIAAGYAQNGTADTLIVYSANGTLLWYYSDGYRGWVTPAFGVSGVLYSGSGIGSVTAFDAEGSVLWSTAYVIPCPIAGIAVSEQLDIAVAVTSCPWSNNNPYITAVRASNGSTLWTRTTACIQCSFAFPSIGDDGLIVVSAFVVNPPPTPSQLYATVLNASSTNTVCSATLKSQMTTAASVGPDGTRFFTTLDGTLYAMNASTCEILWTRAVQSSYGVTVTADGVVYVGVGGGSGSTTPAMALNGTTGSLLWWFTTDVIAWWTTIVVDANNVLYAVQYDLSATTYSLVGWTSGA